jgi:cell division protein DivIC
MITKIKKNYFLLISTFLIIYFFFNLLEGERGLFSYFKKKQTLNNLKNVELELTNKIQDLDFKNSLLGQNLDLDYVEILIREKLLFGTKDETIYILKK